MNDPTPAAIPLPKEPRHQRFADLVLGGRPLVDAYQEAGFRCSRATAKVNANKLRKRHDVAAYIQAVQYNAADDATLSLSEILRFCARVVRTPINQLNPRNMEDPNADLIKSYVIKDGEVESSMRLEKHDPFKAIATHLKLSGEDPETTALQSLTNAFALIGARQSTLPTDQM